MYGQERDNYIKKHIDIMMAMGISAIDTAVLGVPTIIPIVSPTSFRDDKFVYVYDIGGYSLGWDAKDLKVLNYKHHRLCDIVEDIYTKGMKKEIGERCALFSENTFSLEKGAKLLLENVERTKLTSEVLVKNKTVSRTLRHYKLYRKIRKNRDFPMYHLFISRLNRIQNYKGIKKVLFPFIELKKTVNFTKEQEQMK